MRILSSIAAAALLVISACAPAAKPADTAADEAAIRAIVAEWNQYLATQNDSAIAAIYGSQGRLMPANMPAVSGAAEIRQFWTVLWQMKASLTLVPVAVTVSGDVAVERGTWTMSAPTPNGTQEDHGKYLVIWHRENGAWKAGEDIWNSDNPTPPAAAATTKP